MKILHTVEFYHPSVGGMQEVVKQLSEQLARLGHEVTVATSPIPGRTETVINGVRIEEFAVKGNLAWRMTGELDRYREVVINGGFEVVTNFAAQQWATDAVITMLDEIKAKKVFVPTGFSGLYDPRFKDYFASMKSWMKQYDMNVFLSDDYRDINFARECGVQKFMVIPNGASEDEFLPEPEIDIRAQLGIPRDHMLILHVGSHTGIKGHAEAIRIFAKAKFRNATMLIVANDFGGGCARACNIRMLLFNAWLTRKADGKRLLIATLPRMETVAAYQAADLFLFPSNIECSPLVLFESMASRTPFLTTDVGNASEIATWSGGGLLLPTYTNGKGYSRADINGSASMLEEMYENSVRREELAASGYSAWIERFTWEKIAASYEGLYSRLCEGIG
jgi:glycosyltransferase involved in cell wall biosynthesis